MTTYRFWGDVDPRGRTKLPVQAYQPVTESSPWTMFLYEPIDSWGEFWGTSASEVAAALRGVPSDADLLVRLNSPGGEVSEATAIANLLRSRAGRWTALVDGLAASAASYLAVSADELTMGLDTELMIHDPWGAMIGTAADMRTMAELLDSTADTYAAAYQRKAGGEQETWRAAMQAETWYTAAAAVEAGLADRVAGQDTEDDADELDPVGALPVAAAALRPVYAGILGRPVLAGVPPLTPPRAAPAPDPAPAPAPDPAPAPPAAVPVVDMAKFRADLVSALGGAKA